MSGLLLCSKEKSGFLRDGVWGILRLPEEQPLSPGQLGQQLPEPFAGTVHPQAEIVPIEDDHGLVLVQKDVHIVLFLAGAAADPSRQLLRAGIDKVLLSKAHLEVIVAVELEKDAEKLPVKPISKKIWKLWGSSWMKLQ